MSLDYAKRQTLPAKDVAGTVQAYPDLETIPMGRYSSEDMGSLDREVNAFSPSTYTGIPSPLLTFATRLPASDPSIRG